MEKKFGHAITHMILDTTDACVGVASMKIVSAILYSAHKYHSTMKSLVGYDPVGTVLNESISVSNSGSINDVSCTAVTNTLEQIPFRYAVESGKEFLIDNDCVLLGIVFIRIIELMSGQTQKSREDSELTQKVRKTRSVIE